MPPNMYTFGGAPGRAGGVARIPRRDGRVGLPGSKGETGDTGLQGLPDPQGIQVEFMHHMMSVCCEPITNLTSL